jgi:glycosyltransferase involved in cell wall biosynthesis
MRSMPLKVCLVSTEILGWGLAGGFGFATRSLGRELARRGVDVQVVVPRPRETDGPGALLDRIRVHAYARGDLVSCRRLLVACDADVYHTQEPNLGTWIAARALPDRLHVVTARDPRSWSDWATEFRYPTYTRIQVVKTALYYENPLTRAGVRRARAVFVPARCLSPRVQHKYGLSRAPAFLPTPVHMPAAVHKSAVPTVCFVGRLDRRKRPDAFLELARNFPHVRFLIAGRSQHARHGSAIEAACRRLPNVTSAGFIDQFESDGLSRMLGESWILVNTSAREGLPNAFIEACAHRCAILSAVDPDGFASRFGAYVPDRDFRRGLQELLDGERWRERGEAGYRYAVRTNEAGAAAAEHLAMYDRFLRGEPA